MPFPSFDSVDGATIEELVESLEKQRKELQWLLQSLDTQNVKELSADVINAGLLKAKHVQVGGESEFFEGYNPLENDIELRGNLNLTAPLPTYITMNGQGLTAYTDTVGMFARLDYRGLYVQGGAVDIRTSQESKRGIILDAYGFKAYNALGEATVDITSDGHAKFSGDIVGGSINIRTDIQVGRYLTIGNGFDALDKGITFKGSAASVTVYGDSMNVSASDVYLKGNIHFEQSTSVTGLYARFG